MRVLGISELDNDSGAALFVDGKLSGAASEERFTRRKRQAGFPRAAAAWLLDQARLEARDLDAVVIAKPRARAERQATRAPLAAYDWWSAPAPWRRQAVNWLAFQAWKLPHNHYESWRYQNEADAWLKSQGVPEARVVRLHHHRSHAASAYFASGFERALAVTMDGQGGGVTASVWRCEGTRLELVHEVKTPDSLGFFYALVTRALGFRPARHEGKVTGLAAFAPAAGRPLELCRELARFAAPGFETPGLYGALGELKALAREHGPAAVASAAQCVLEEVATAYVRHHFAGSHLTRIVLAGGVFANVRLNQKVAEIPGVDELFVFPHMGDGGLAYGAVVDFLAAERGRKPEAIDDVYWGPGFDEAACAEALRAAGLAFTRPRSMAAAAAELLAQGRTVGRFDGRMEFGPRALGNRSILYQASDPSVNDWLNKALKRTEFMPFAPATLAAAAPSAYQGLERARHAAEFMTVTFACSRAMRDEAPAVVHVDGTARPQLVRAETNPDYHALIAAYRDLTGLSSVINTSFNMHEEPIVMSPRDAVAAAQASQLDALILGPYLAVRSHPARGARR